MLMDIFYNFFFNLTCAIKLIILELVIIFNTCFVFCYANELVENVDIDIDIEIVGNDNNE